MRSDSQRKLVFWNNGHPMFAGVVEPTNGGDSRVELTLYPWGGRQRSRWDLIIPPALSESRLRVILPIWGFPYSYLDEEAMGLEEIFNYVCRVLNVRDGFPEIGWEIESIEESSFKGTAYLTVVLTAPARECGDGEKLYWEDRPVDTKEEAIEWARRFYFEEEGCLR